jgi:hypothetical protein
MGSFDVWRYVLTTRMLFEIVSETTVETRPMPALRRSFPCRSSRFGTSSCSVFYVANQG